MIKMKKKYGRDKKWLIQKFEDEKVKSQSNHEIGVYFDIPTTLSDWAIQDLLTKYPDFNFMVDDKEVSEYDRSEGRTYEKKKFTEVNAYRRL